MKDVYLKIIIGGIATVAIAVGSYAIAELFPIYSTNNIPPEDEKTETQPKDTLSEGSESPVTHIPTPPVVRAIYMTSCAASSQNFRDNLLSIIDSTEINSIVIDIKDFTGRVSFRSGNEIVDAPSRQAKRGCHVPDMEEFVAALHERGIYVIGRITVFQDPLYTRLYPDLAIKRESDGEVWKDYKGLSFIDVGAEPFWDYIVEISKESYAIGFDELNFDYIRYPSDGPTKDIAYPHSQDLVDKYGRLGRQASLELFFTYLYDELRDTDVVTSADLFGMTTTHTHDLNIGQVLESVEPYFDYISPMVYPSHYAKGFNNWQNPNEHVYGVVSYSMNTAVARFNDRGLDTEKLRPWLQDFDYGGNYGEQEVRAQIQAVYDAGLTSWMIWDPANRYTESAFVDTDTVVVEKEEAVDDATSTETGTK